MCGAEAGVGAMKEGVALITLPSLSSVCDPHLRLPLWPRRPGRPGPVFPQRPVRCHLPGLSPHAQPAPAPHPPTGAAAEEAGPARPPLFFHSEGAPCSRGAGVRVVPVTREPKPYLPLPQIPQNLPCSVTLQPGPEDTGKV